MNPPTKIKYLPLPGKTEGLEEALTFAPLTITERYKFIDHLVASETPQIVALCTRRKIEWVNSLDFACYLELAKQFIRENFSMAMQIATADPIAGLKVGPLLVQMGRVLSLLPGPSSSPTPSNGATSGSDSPSAPGPAAVPAESGPPSAITLPASSPAL